MLACCCCDPEISVMPLHSGDSGALIDWRLIRSMTSDLCSLHRKHVCAQIYRSYSRKQTSRKVLCLPPLHYVFSLEQQRVSLRGMCEGGVSSSGSSGTSALIPPRLFINRRHINISKNELLKHIFYLHRIFRINSDVYM